MSEQIAGNEDTLPRINVLLAAYQGMNFLPAQVATILQQASVEVSLTVSVDSSSDGTEAWFADLAQRDDRVRLLPQGGTFGSAASNFFRLVRDAETAGFDYLAFADQDDIWLPGKLHRATSVLESEGFAGYSSDVLAWREGGTAKPLMKSQNQRRWDHLFSSPGPGCTHVLRRDVFVEFQRLAWDAGEQLAHVEYHDWLDYAFVRQGGHRWFIDSQPHMLYRQHGSNQLGANAGVEAIRRRLAMLREGWLWRQSELVCELVGAQDSWPCRLLTRGGLRSRLLLAAMSPWCRRTPAEAAVLAMSFLFAKARSTR